MKAQCNIGSTEISQPQTMVPGGEVITSVETGAAAQQQRNADQAQSDKEHDRTVIPYNERQHTTKEKRTLDQPKSQQTRKRLRRRRTNNPQRGQASTTDEDTGAVASPITQQVQHTDQTRHDVCKRKQRESETIHDNPRKRKKNVIIIMVNK